MKISTSIIFSIIMLAVWISIVTLFAKIDLYDIKIKRNQNDKENIRLCDR